MSGYLIGLTVCLCLLTIVTRAFPFFFASKLEGNETMKLLGKRLAAYIMLLLVAYQVNPKTLEAYPFGWPAVVSLILVVIVHRLFHKPLLSMLIGTACYISINLYA